MKPRRQREYPELGFEAGVKAMLDAQINYDEVEMGVACYCYGDTTSGQRIFYQFGMSTIPIYNTNVRTVQHDCQAASINQCIECMRYGLDWASYGENAGAIGRRRLCVGHRLRTDVTRHDQERLV